MHEPLESAGEEALETPAGPLYGAGSLRGVAPEEILVVSGGVAPERLTGGAAWLCEALPGAGLFLARGEPGERPGAGPGCERPVRRHRALIVAENDRRLLAAGLRIASEERFVLRGRRLVAYGALDLVREHVAARMRGPFRRWMDLQIPAPLGPGNDYRFIAERLGGLEADWPRLSVSVVVPVYDRRDYLARTLAALQHQDYPHELFEVIVADDGSSDHPDEVVDKLAGELDVRIVRQEDEGYRLCAIRNLAIEAARGDVIVCLDCDMLPPPGHLRALLRWFHVHTGPLVVIGTRDDVDAEALSPSAILADPGAVEGQPRIAAPDSVRSPGDARVEWRVPVFESSRMLVDHRAPFETASGGNLAYRRCDALTVGLHDPEFRNWGGEDDEFGYRMLRRGAYFIPEPWARARHQAHPDSVGREADRKHSNRLLGRKVPHFRERSPDGSWEAPKVSVYIPAYDAGPWIRGAVESALDQTLGDLEVCICNDGSRDDTLDILERHFADEPRVRWLSQSNRGTPAASRAAVDLCRGEYILELDADDELLPRAAEVLAGVLDRDPGASVAYAGLQEFGARARVLLPERYSAYAHLLGNVVLHPRMFRARDYYRTSGFDERWPSAEDYALSLELAEQGRVHAVHEVLYRYRVHAGSATARGADRQGRFHLEIVREALARRGLGWTVEPFDPGRPGHAELRHSRAMTCEPLRRLARLLRG